MKYYYDIIKSEIFFGGAVGMKKILLLVVICFLGTISGASANSLKVSKIDYKLIYEHERNNELQYPLLLYNDFTYIAMRDAAKMFGMEIVWNEDEKEIRWAEKYERPDIIRNNETALAVGKAILKRHFGDKINERSIFGVCYTEGGLYYRNLWQVSVIYEPEDREYTEEDMAIEADDFVDIEPTSGRFRVNGVGQPGNSLDHWD